MKRGAIAVGLVLALSACIPRGVDEPAVVSDEPSNAETPQLVPERAIIAETPSWSPAVVERNARSVATSTYVVQPGDSLFAIASKTGAGATAIADANSLAPPYPIRSGDRLRIPGGFYHRVGAGETGIAIARAYGVRWADIVVMNGLQPPYTLQLGQNLLLPSGALTDDEATELTPEQRAAAFALNIDDIVTGGQPAGTASVQAPVTMNFDGRFIWPVRGTIVRRFGAQGSGRVNDGLGIAAARGASVGAAAPGRVVYAGNEIGLLGGLVLVDHGKGWVTAYGHMASLAVAKNDRVTTGQLLGTVGETGYVSEPQLYFEVRKDRKPQNPLIYLQTP